MAMRISAGPNVGRQDFFLIDPKEIIVDQSANGRVQPHGDPEVASLAKSYEEEGQIQPVQVRRIHQGKVQLVFGYRRHAAALLYNQMHPDNPMRLKCICVDINEEEAFRRNIVENRERAECTPVDDAHNQRRLREQFGWTDVKIAEFYRVSQGYIHTLKKLLVLPSEIQEQVAEKTLSVNAAVALAELSDSDRREVLAQVRSEQAALVPTPTTIPEQAAPVADATAPTTTNNPALNGTTDHNDTASAQASSLVPTLSTTVPPKPVILSSAAILSRVRDKKIDNGAQRSTARTLREVRALFETMAQDEDNTELKALASTFLRYLTGKVKDKTMMTVFRGYARTTEPEPAYVG